jgi:hypothetical protein
MTRRKPRRKWWGRRPFKAKRYVNATEVHEFENEVILRKIRTLTPTPGGGGPVWAFSEGQDPVGRRARLGDDLRTGRTRSEGGEGGMTNEPEFLPSLDLSFTRPDEWPLYPALPLHRNDAEVGFLIDGYGFPPNTLILLNIFDPLFRRLLTHGTVAATSIVVFQLPEIIAEEGWSLGLVPGWGLEHLRDWDRRHGALP